MKLRNICKGFSYTAFVSCAVLAGSILLAACQKEDNSLVDLTAVIENSNNGAKVTIDNDRYACWHNGDEISINGATYTVNVGTAEGVTSVTINEVPYNSNGYAAVYPAECHQNEMAGSTTATIKLPDVQVWDAEHIVTPMVAYTTGSTLTFRNPCNLLKVTLTNTTGNELQIHQIIVTSSHTKLSGTATITELNGTPSVSKVENGTKDVTLECKNATLGSTPLTFYVTVPNCSGEQFRFRVLAKNGDTKYTFDANSQSGINLTQNQMVPIAVTLSSSTPNTTATFWGTGSDTYPYLITDEDDLINLRTVTNDGTSGYCDYSVYYKQTADIDISSDDYSSWGHNNTAIGTESKPFMANYDGGNHFVKLAINITTSSTAGIGVGLFGHIGLPTVTNKNTIKDLEVRGSIAGSTSVRNYGGIAGFARGTTEFNHCINRADITNNCTSSAGGACGGICAAVGYNNGSSLIQAGVVQFTNCYNYGTLNIAKEHSYSWNTSNRDFTGIGGVCGSVSNASSCTFDGCENHGLLYGGDGTNYYYVGGIVGYGRTALTFINTNLNADDAIVKGIQSGGIVGKAYGGVYADGSSTILKNEGTIIGNQQVGGIIGYVLMNNSLTGQLESSESASVSGTYEVGGIIGTLGTDLKASDFSGTFHNKGSVTGSSNSIGGIIGSICVDFTLSGSFINTGNVSGTYCVGGICGKTYVLTFASGSDATNEGCVTSNSSYTFYTHTSNSTSSRTTSATGGIIGLCTKLVNNGTLINGNKLNTEKGEVQNTANYTDVGGIVGCCIRYKSSKSANSYISGNSSGYISCGATSKMTNYGYVHSGSNSVGGICGCICSFGDNRVTSTIKNSYNYGNILGKAHAGGIIGRMYYGGSISNCINEGNITASSYETSSGVAGIVGTADGGGTFRKCLNKKPITGTAGSGSLNIGGIVGYCGNGVSLSDCGNRGKIEGKGYAISGLVGACRSSSSSIENSYNQGDIIISGSTTLGGGITSGYSIKPTITNCYFSGNVTFTATPTYFGNMSGSYNNSSSYKATCVDCYSISTECNGSNYASANYTISISSNEGTTGYYATDNSDQNLLTALNGGVPSATEDYTYSTWTTTTKDALGNPVYTELPHLSWEDPASKRR